MSFLKNITTATKLKDKPEDVPYAKSPILVEYNCFFTKICMDCGKKHGKHDGTGKWEQAMCNWCNEKKWICHPVAFGFPNIGYPKYETKFNINYKNDKREKSIFAKTT